MTVSIKPARDSLSIQNTGLGRNTNNVDTYILTLVIFEDRNL